MCWSCLCSDTGEQDDRGVNYDCNCRGTNEDRPTKAQVLEGESNMLESPDTGDQKNADGDGLRDTVPSSPVLKFKVDYGPNGKNSAKYHKMVILASADWGSNLSVYAHKL